MHKHSGNRFFRPKHISKLALQRTLIVGVTLLLASAWAHATPPFNANETLRKAEVGIYSRSYRDDRDKSNDKSSKAGATEDTRTPFSSGAFRCYQDLSRPLTGDVICRGSNDR